ncbi:MAG: hypothetical protein R2834_04235 [Rhodothermales bacterium]
MAAQEFAAVADSSVYDRIALEGRPLRGRTGSTGADGLVPVLQITGDSLQATATAGSIDSLLVRGAPAAREDTTIERIHQLRGENLMGLFQEDSSRA